jgi:hypothetical protein
MKPQGRVAIQARNQENIDQPADAQEAQRKEPDGSRYRFAEIEAMRAGKAKYP